MHSSTRANPKYAWQDLLGNHRPSVIVRSMDRISEQLPVIYKSNNANELKEFMQAIFKFFEEAESSIALYDRTPQYGESKDAKPALHRLNQFRLNFFREIPMEPLNKIESSLDPLLRNFFENKAPYEPELTACMLNRGFRTKDKDTFHLMLGHMFHDSVINDFVDKVLCQQNNETLLNELIETKNSNTKTAWEAIFDFYRPDSMINTLLTALRKHIDTHPAAQVLINKITELQNSRLQEKLLAEAREDERKARERKEYDELQRELQRELERKQSQVQKGPITISADLERFIKDIENGKRNNKDLSEKYSLDPEKHNVACNINEDFPKIPVIFNGRLYDYESLKLLIINGHIEEPQSRSQIPINMIQPGYDAQRRMNELFDEQEEIAKKKAEMQGAEMDAITVKKVLELWKEFNKQSFLQKPGENAVEIFTACITQDTDQLRYKVLADFINDSDPDCDRRFQQFLINWFGRERPSTLIEPERLPANTPF